MTITFLKKDINHCKNNPVQDAKYRRRRFYIYVYLFIIYFDIFYKLDFLNTLFDFFSEPPSEPSFFDNFYLFIIDHHFTLVDLFSVMLFIIPYLIKVFLI